MNLKSLLEKDAAISMRLRVAENPGLLRNIATFFAHSGDSWFWFLGLPILWFYGDSDWKYRVLFLFSSILVTAAIVLVLKFSIRRSRPEGEWGKIYRKTDPHSFPSGHATRGMLIGVIALGLGPIWFGVLLIVWGPLVGIARIAMGVHYLSDVVAGWIVGLIIGLVCLQYSPIIIEFIFNNLIK